MAPPRKDLTRMGILGAIQTPLAFYVLALLIVETTLAIVLTRLDKEHQWQGFLCMIGIFGAVVVTVTVLTIWFPKNLLYGKEEHSVPQLAPSALKDQIEDLIVSNVKPECLKKHEINLR